MSINNAEKLVDKIEKEYVAYKSAMLLNLPSEIFEKAYEIRFFTEIYEYFTSDIELSLTENEIKTLLNFQGKIIEELYDYYLSKEFTTIESWEEITGWIKVFIKNNDANLRPDRNKTLISIEEVNGVKRVHFLGYGYFSGEPDEKPYRWADYIFFYSELKKAVEYGLERWEKDNCGEIKQYISDMSKEEYKKVEENATTLFFDEITIDHPLGMYILKER